MTDSTNTTAAVDDGGGFWKGFESNEEYAAFWTRKLVERAGRLHRLTELKAPGMILAGARRLCAEALEHIPLDVESARLEFNMQTTSHAEEQEHLYQTGYYAGLEKELGLGESEGEGT
jgi:hypothetical protein